MGDPAPSNCYRCRTHVRGGAVAADAVPTTVLGIDPGLTRCGIGIVQGPDRRPTVVHHDCVRTDRDLPIEQRLAALQEAIEAAIARFRPDAVAVERVLFSSNVRSAMA